MSETTPYVRQIQAYVEDTRARTVLSDGFEDAPLDWAGIGGVDVDWVVERVTTKKRDGGASLHLSTPATTPDTNDYVVARRNIGMPNQLGILEASYDIFVASDPATLTVGIEFNVYSGGILQDIQMRWDGGDWQFYNSGGTWTDLGLTTFSYGDIWNNIAIRADVANSQLISARVNNNVVDLGRVALRSSAAGGNYLSTAVRLTTLTSAQRELWVDNARILML